MYEKLPTEEDVEMTEEPAAVARKETTGKQQATEFIPTIIRNEIEIDVSMLERKEPTENADE